MPIDLKTIASLQQNSITTLEGRIAPGCERGFLDSIILFKSEHFILKNVSAEALEYCQFALRHPNLKSIIVRSLQNDAWESLISYLKQRQTPLTLVLENPAETEFEAIIHELSESNIQIVCKLNKCLNVNIRSKVNNNQGTKQVYLQYSFYDPNRTNDNEFILSITLCNKQLFSFNMNRAALQHLEEFPKEMLFADLLNLLSEHAANPNNDNVCRDIIQNYFNGPLPDFLDYNNNRFLTISEELLNPEAVAELQSVFEQEGLVLCKSPFPQSGIKGLWLRDYFICAGNGKYFMNVDCLNENYISTLQHYYEIDFFHPYGKVLSTGVKLLAPCNGVDITEKEKLSSVKKIITTHRIVFQEMKAFVEGGNIFTVNKNNKKYVLIGRSSILQTAALRAELNLADPKLIAELNVNKSKNPVSKQFYETLQKQNYPIQRGHLKEAKLAIANGLNIHPKQLIKQLNVFYHLDLFLMVLPNGKLGQINYQIAIDKLKDINSPAAQLIVSGTEKKQAVYGEYLEANKAKLVAKGFAVVDIPAFCYESEMGGIRTLATLANGYSGRGKQGNFYIALVPAWNEDNSQVDEYDERLVIDEQSKHIILISFEEVLKNNGVNNIYYIGDSVLSDELFNELEGGLRCVSTPGSPLGRLEKASETTNNNAAGNVSYNQQNINLNFFNSNNNNNNNNANDQQAVSNNKKQKLSRDQR